MISWVNEMMVKWGEWMAGRSSYGSAGPAFPAYQLVHIRSTAGSEELVDADVMEIDRIMGLVKVTRRELYETAYERYALDLSTATIAGRMRCHRDTVLSRINSLHKIVENRFAPRDHK